jgi:hypothetical protein
MTEGKTAKTGLVEAQDDRLTPKQMRELADSLMEETAHRGMLVRLAAAFKARELRRDASKMEAHHG